MQLDIGTSKFAVALGVACALGALGCTYNPKKPEGDPRPAAQGEPPVRPPGPVPLAEARKYVLDLVNYDRSKHGLAAVERDETAEKAAQRHAEDMAKNGYTGHWGTDGSVPELRYTEAGGDQLVSENSACFFDGQARELDPNPLFDPVKLEQIESAFYNEKPPNDGHRKNILKGWHNLLGVGLAKPVGVDQPCMAQEFVDDYGTYDGVPRKGRVGQKIMVRGSVKAPAQFGGVGIGRVDVPEPIPVEELLKTGSYPLPQPHEIFFPEGYQTRVPVKIEGDTFSIEVALDKGPGLYGVSVWGRYPDQKKDELVMVSLRTILVQ